MEQKPSFFKRASDGEARRERREEREDIRETRREEREDRGDRRMRASRDERPARFDRPQRSERPERDPRGTAVRRVPRIEGAREDSRTERSRERNFGRGDDRGYERRAPRREFTPRDRYNDRNSDEAPRKDFGAGRKPLAIPENLIFGIHPIREALEAGTQLEKIYTIKRGNDSIQEIIGIAEERGVVIQYVPTPKLDYLSKQNNHQGVVATVAQIEYAELGEIMEKEPKLLLVLDGVTDVRNFGAIARSAECSGVDAIIVSSKNSAPINGEAMKSAAGALSRIPVCKVGSLRNALKTVQLAGVQLVAATEKTESSIYDIDLTTPTAIIMGSEQRGISSETLKLCDSRGSIPMLGTIESLNVSAAAAVILYEAVRQRR